MEYQISGDVKLGIGKKIVWFFLNLLRGIRDQFGYFRSQLFVTRSFPDGVETPFRKNIDSFFNDRLPRLIRKKNISVLDIGCGRGYLQEILHNHGFSGMYLGIDVQDHKRFTDYSNESFESSFIQTRIEDFSPEEKFDLVVTNTVLEHVEDDYTGAQRASELVKSDGVQIHIIPGFWSLFLYLWHGYRQYGPRRLNTLFGKQNYRGYRVGGFFSYLVHFIFVSIPYRLRMKMTLRKTRMYSMLCRWAHVADQYVPLFPAGYIVVIKGEKE